MSEPHKGFWYVEEEASRLIDRSFDKPCDARNAAHCYATLCRVANLKGSDTFEISIASLAGDLHCVYRDAQKALALVEAINLVKIERRKVPGSKENAPSVYTLIRLRTDIMSVPTDIMSEGGGKGRVHDPSRSFPKNSPKNLQELPITGAASPRTRFVAPTLHEIETETAAMGMAVGEGQAFIDHHEARGWMLGKNPMKSWKAALRTWKRTGERLRATSQAPKRKELGHGTDPSTGRPYG